MRFCGFKAYHVPSLAKLEVTETGYAMPLELWVQAAHQNFKIVELPVPLIYLEEARSFGGSLDNADTRLRHYREIIDRSVAALRGEVPARFHKSGGVCGSRVVSECCSTATEAGQKTVVRKANWRTEIRAVLLILKPIHRKNPAAAEAPLFVQITWIPTAQRSTGPIGHNEWPG